MKHTDKAVHGYAVHTTNPLSPLRSSHTPPAESLFVFVAVFVVFVGCRQRRTRAGLEFVAETKGDGESLVPPGSHVPPPPTPPIVQ
jgi:hypothetical protein